MAAKIAHTPMPSPFEAAPCDNVLFARGYIHGYRLEIYTGGEFLARRFIDNTDGNIDGARLTFADDSHFEVRVDHSEIPEFWLNIRIPLNYTNKLQTQGRVTYKDGDSCRVSSPDSLHSEITPYDPTNSVRVVTVTCSEHPRFFVNITLPTEQVVKWIFQQKEEVDY